MDSKNFQLKKILIIFISITLLICLAFFGNNKTTQNNNNNYVTDINYNKLEFSNFDKDVSIDDCVLIDTNSINESVLNINGGSYLLSGDFEGNIVVDAKDEKVHLVFDDFHIKSTGGPAIIVKDCDKIVITLTEGSNNIVEDNGDFRNFDEYDACIDSTSSLTINGKGSLLITGLYKDAIHTKDVLKIIDSSIDTKVKRNSFQGNDGIRVANANMFIQSEKNGFKTTKSNLQDRGYIAIENTTMSIISGRVSFISKSNLYIKNSSITHRSVVTLYEVEGEAYIEEGSIK